MSWEILTRKYLAHKAVENLFEVVFSSRSSSRSIFFQLAKLPVVRWISFFFYSKSTRNVPNQTIVRKYIYKYITTVTSWSRKVGVFPLKNTIRYIT